MLLCACTEAEEKAQAKLPTEDITIKTMSGAALTIKAEIAKTELEKSCGLMFRTELKDGQAMLFVFENDRILSFWMKNTLIPLSIAFISSDGTIAEIYDMKPKSLSSTKSMRSLRYALEVPKGYFSRASIAEGDKLDLSFLSADK